MRTQYMGQDLFKSGEWVAEDSSGERIDPRSFSFKVEDNEGVDDDGNSLELIVSFMIKNNIQKLRFNVKDEEDDKDKE